MNTIYLVGQISARYPESYLWRKRFTENFEERENIRVIDPCQTEMNDKLLKTGEYAVTPEGNLDGLNLLVPKDYNYVLESTIGVVNMNQYDPGKPLLGSYFELAWYYANPQKAVIGFADDLNSYICKHPFVQATVHAWCENEQQVYDYIDYYFARSW